MSKALPNAGKPGKRRKDSGDKESNPRGSESSHKLDPKSVQSYGAFCPQCESIGLYLDPGDAQRAENLHQQRKHGNSPHKKTNPVELQNKRNKGQG